MFNLARVLVPVDFSGCSTRALRYAVELAEQVGANVEVLHVYRPPHDFFPPISISEPDGTRSTAHQFARREAERELRELLNREAPSRSALLRPMVTCGDPTDEILAHVDTGGYDLVVMGTHGRSGLAHWLLGSVAESVLRRSHCPVLTVSGPLLRPRSKPASTPARRPEA